MLRKGSFARKGDGEFRQENAYASSTYHPHYSLLSNPPQAGSMIVLKITNASELVASKVGRFLERLTPDELDSSTVEDQVIKKMIESLAAEGLKGEIAAVNGLDFDGEQIVLNEGLKVRQQATF
ncbi:Hypothetical protein P9303_19801 [Prochlorococcus marinus str. MIT 9303]|uniref:Uncharacterized protein n=2 Tax=Prochlorococcus marinus TaxID=1219 RepID=A2CB62_PROM3|nr:Hypothetical protein P9303_19801 [Prochlorococcus marinus str. MIT 9303]